MQKWCLAVSEVSEVPIVPNRKGETRGSCLLCEMDLVWFTFSEREEGDVTKESRESLSLNDFYILECCIYLSVY